MSRNDKKRELHRRKREQHRREANRIVQSPYRRLGAVGELVACYVNESWRKAGIASMFVLRRAPGHGMAMAAFLVDIWCAGLKDAWGRLHTNMHEFEDGILYSEGGIAQNLVRVDLGVVRRLVAGGIRFAQQNGFRLPPKYERWSAMLGDLGDCASADLSDFGRDGKLHWVGPLYDLQERLIGCSVDEFLSRKDVEYTVGVEEDDDFEEEDEDNFDMDELLKELQSHWMDALRRWCFANGIAPHPRLDEAVEWLLTSATQIRDQELCDEEEEEAEVDASASDIVDGAAFDFAAALSRLEEDGGEDMTGAIAQLDGFMEQFRSPDELSTALGFPSQDEEEE
jgi:hypothetical protein